MHANKCKIIIQTCTRDRLRMKYLVKHFIFILYILFSLFVLFTVVVFNNNKCSKCIISIICQEIYCKNQSRFWWFKGCAPCRPPINHPFFPQHVFPCLQSHGVPRGQHAIWFRIAVSYKMTFLRVMMLYHNRWALIRRILLILLPPGGAFACCQCYSLSVGWKNQTRFFVVVW